MRSAVLVLLVLPALCLGQGQIQFNNNAYSEVIVSISPDVPNANGQQVVDGIKSWIQQGSNVLYTATRKLAYISRVKILIPSTWTGINDVTPSNDIAYEDGVIRIDTPNPLYEDYPYTVQSGGCGDRGEFIHITADFAKEVNTGLVDTVFGPPGNLFTHMWAKLRYGVFEEYGFPGDANYPLFYNELEFTINGYETVERNNFCVDQELVGHNQDMMTGGYCRYDDNTGLPDLNCIFVPDGDNSNVQSSMMATPFLPSTSQFCEDGEFFTHNRNNPSKHNALCETRDTWDIISNNDDFINVQPLEPDTPPATEFEILGPQLGQFVMVLDRSGSMHNQEIGTHRIDRLKQSAARWLKLDVDEGSQVGITSFSSDTSEDAPMTLIDSEAKRDELINIIFEIEATGGTCLGEGVRQGLETLGEATSYGGVMLFITDGEFDCPSGGTELTDPVLQQEIIDSGVRIVTIAFSENADPNLEQLALISNGKTYFIPDGTGVEDINDAFSGSLTYQPSVSSDLLDILIASGSIKNYVPTPLEKIGTFYIDSSLGRDVKIQIDYGLAVTIDKVLLYEGSNDPTPIEFLSSSSLGTVFYAELGDLQPGSYDFGIESDARQILFVDYKVTSKAQADTLPIHVRCYVDTGNEEIDLQGQPLAVLAQVTQGNSPVMNAVVEAQIEKEGVLTPITLDLLDDGSAADVMSNDGIYSRYFAGFDDDGRYTLKCQVTGDDYTDVNGGFLNENRLRTLAHYKNGMRTVQGSSPVLPICCGSDTVNANTVRIPTGGFERPATGGSFKVTNVPSPGTDVYPPQRVTDLKAQLDVANQAVILTFTSPGDDYSDGTVSSYDIRFSLDSSDYLLDNFPLADPLTNADLTSGSTLDPVPGLTVKTVSVRVLIENQPDKIMFFALTASDGTNVSPISNVAQILVSDNYPSKSAAARLGAW